MIDSVLFFNQPTNFIVYGGESIYIFNKKSVLGRILKKITAFGLIRLNLPHDKQRA